MVARMRTMCSVAGLGLVAVSAWTFSLRATLHHRKVCSYWMMQCWITLLIIHVFK